MSPIYEYNVLSEMEYTFSVMFPLTNGGKDFIMLPLESINIDTPVFAERITYRWFCIAQICENEAC